MVVKKKNNCIMMNLLLIVDLFDRIATKKCVYFSGPGDAYMLRNGTKGT